MKSPASLRWRLLAGVLSAVAVAWMLVATAGYLQARHELDELFDAHLAQTAGILAAQISNTAGPIEIERTPQLHRYAVRVAFQVWEQGRLGLHSLSAPAARLGAIDQGFGYGDGEGQRWRVFSASVPGRDALIQVAERVSAREEVTQEVAEHLLVPLAVGLPLLGLALAFAIGRGLKPLTDLAGQVSTRDPGRLEPIRAGTVPVEAHPLVDQINALFERMTASLEIERRFTADASHELRTPIAAIRAQAQVAREAADSAERRHALDNLLLACDRATRLTEQLLALARLDAGKLSIAAGVCDLFPVARGVLAELGPCAHERGITLEFVAAEGLKVRGEETLLHVLIRNLVDNAIRYSPPGVAVTVRLAGDSGGTTLDVIDQGPGVPAEQRERVLGRFYRMAEFETGSGLGLSIALRIAERCGAELALLDPAGHSGVRATVLFPAV